MKIHTNLIFGCVLLLLCFVCHADPNSLISEEVTLYFGIETNLPDPCRPVTVDYTHTDLDVSFTSLGWGIIISNDTLGDHDPNQCLLYGNENTYYSDIPAGFEFTGANEGDELWILPQQAYNGELPLGITAKRSDSSNLRDWDPNDPDKGADTAAKWYRIRLLDVRGPADANFSMWQTSPTTVYMSTAWGGITDEDAYYIIDGSNCSHMNWGFTKQGNYQVDIEVSTVYRCDEELTADLWPVGDEYYRGDCIVDIHDYAVLARNWFITDCDSQPNLCEGADLNQPADNQIDLKDLNVLAQQWFSCGYPGCDQ